jgi:hypothetical protein
VDLGVEGVEVVIECSREFARGTGSSVTFNEEVPQERENEAGVARTQKSPCGVPLP